MSRSTAVPIAAQSAVTTVAGFFINISSAFPTAANANAPVICVAAPSPAPVIAEPSSVGVTVCGSASHRSRTSPG